MKNDYRKIISAETELILMTCHLHMAADMTIWVQYSTNNICNNYKTLKETAHYVRVEVFTAVTMENAVFWDIKTQFVPYRKHITSPLQNPAS
jgi:hypothetical protein